LTSDRREFVELGSLRGIFLQRLQMLTILFDELKNKSSVDGIILATSMRERGSVIGESFGIDGIDVDT
jgi:spore coat polysaccharide biosynthesis protein SpsF (cytidylyltransferase family)